MDRSRAGILDRRQWLCEVVKVSTTRQLSAFEPPAPDGCPDAAPGDCSNAVPVRRKTLFGRRKGKALHGRQRELYGGLLPALSFDPDRHGADPLSAFGPGCRALAMEIGFGGGEHLAAQAVAHPDVAFIGCEPFANGVAKLLSEIERLALDNVRVFHDDARTVIAALPARALTRVFILFPDPWPKRRHVKRRLVDAPFLATLSRVMAVGGELRVATDIVDYARSMDAAFAATPAFRCLTPSAAEWSARPPDWPPTRYEAKAVAAKRAPRYMRYVHEPTVG
ncbi:MAG: tRNA (guanosine(46)-N7)-methyltransferase TrmB [Rhizobiales bacterium]|nr:tRNA (guanosine(46)-N7)-methyltransferase TrmB [Hyphomicrobiales bacterium]